MHVSMSPPSTQRRITTTTKAIARERVTSLQAKRASRLDIGANVGSSLNDDAIDRAEANRDAPIHAACHSGNGLFRQKPKPREMGPGLRRGDGSPREAEIAMCEGGVSARGHCQNSKPCGQFQKEARPAGSSGRALPIPPKDWQVPCEGSQQAPAIQGRFARDVPLSG